MSRPKKSSECKLVTVKKFAAIAGLLCCFFLAGVALGCYAGVRLQSCHYQLGTNQMVSDDGYDYDVSFRDVVGNVDDISFYFNGDTADVTKFLINLSVVPEYYKHEIIKKLNLSSTDTVAIHNYHTNSPKYKDSNNSAKFYSNGRTLGEEHFEEPFYLYFFEGSLESRVVLMKNEVNFENLDFASVAGAAILMPHGDSSMHWARFLEIVGAKAVLFYDEDASKDCAVNASHGVRRSFGSDPTVLGYPSAEGIYKMPLEEAGLSRIPVEVVSCRTVTKISPHLSSKEVMVRLQLNARPQPIIISNLMVSFHGDREPGVSVIVGASRSNPIGMQRLMKLLRTTSAIRTGRARRSLGFTVRFVAWSDPDGFGMFEFFETYKYAWGNKVVAYVDLDRYYSKDVRLLASSSLKEFLKGILERTSSKTNPPLAIAVETIDESQNVGSGGGLFEREMGVPCVRVLSDLDEKTESDVLRVLGVATLAAAAAGRVNVSVADTADDVMTAIEQLVRSFPFVATKIPALARISKQFKLSLENFQSFVESDLVFHSGVRIINDMIMKAENILRKLLYQLKCLAANPVLQSFEKSNFSFIESPVLSSFLRSFCKSEFVPLDRDVSIESYILYESAIIASKLQTVIKIVSPPE